MATMSIRSTYALDAETAQRIKRLARAWGVSQAEVIRRSVSLASEHDEKHAELSPADVVRYYRAHPAPRDARATRSLIAELRKQRHEDDQHRAGRSEA